MEVTEPFKHKSPSVNTNSTDYEDEDLLAEEYELETSHLFYTAVLVAWGFPANFVLSFVLNKTLLTPVNVRYIVRFLLENNNVYLLWLAITTLTLKRKFAGNEFSCNIERIFTLAMLNIDSWVYVVMGMDRLILVSKPSTYRRLITKKNVTLVLIMLPFMDFALLLPSSLTYKVTFSTLTNKTICTKMEKVIINIDTEKVNEVIWLVLMTVPCVVNVLLTLIIWNHWRKKGRENVHIKGDRMLQKRQVSSNFTKSYLTSSIFHACLQLPYIIWLFSRATETSEKNHFLYESYFLVASSNTGLPLIFFGILYKDGRVTLWRLMRGKKKGIFTPEIQTGLTRFKTSVTDVARALKKETPKVRTQPLTTIIEEEDA